MAKKSKKSKRTRPSVSKTRLSVSKKKKAPRFTLTHAIGLVAGGVIAGMGLYSAWSYHHAGGYFVAMLGLCVIGLIGALLIWGKR